MSKAHYVSPAAVLVEDARTVRLGGTSTKFTSVDAYKFVKLAAESEYDLCAAGDPIEAIVVSVDSAPSGGFSIGSITDDGVLFVIADGLEATPGTGTIAVGDYVVCGTVTARNTAMTDGMPKVCKATNQPGAAITSTLAGADTAAAVKTVLDAALVKVADAGLNGMFAWRVESLGTAGTGAVGTMLAIKRVNG